MRARTLKAILALATVLATLPPPARADEAADRAKKHNAAAKTLFNLGRFEEAAAEYEQAYRARPIPEFLANIGQCHKRLGTLAHLRRALFYFESYINNATNPTNRREIEEEIAELKLRIERLTRDRATSRPATSRPASRPSTRPAMTPLPPPTAEPVRVTRGRPARPARTPFYKKWWFWTALSAVVAGTTVGLAVGLSGGDTRMPAGPVVDHSTFR